MNFDGRATIELQSLRTKLAELERIVADNQKKELARLPAKYGFGNVDDFVAAVRSAAGKRRGRKLGAAKARAGKVGRRHRAVITDETRAEVKRLVGEGKSGAEIAKSVGILLPSVQNIKKALGLVKKREK